MSFTTDEAAGQWEHKVPSIKKRLEALHKLQLAGWKVAIRFEPLILGAEGLAPYEALFAQIFSKIDVQRLHSVSSGLFRMPVDFHKRIVRLYPDEELFARPTQTTEGMIGLKSTEENTHLVAIEELLLKYVSSERILSLCVIFFWKTMESKDLNNPGNKKLVVVTGASSGIGLALVRALLGEEYAVLGIANNFEKAGLSHPDFSSRCINLADLDALEKITVRTD